MAHRAAALTLALAGCGPSFAFTQITLPAPTPCELSPTLPPLDPRFAPALSGAVTLVSADGDARFSATGLVPTTWSADGAEVASGEQGWVTIWRVADGTAIDHIACPIDGGPWSIAMSANGRWIAAGGVQRTAGGKELAACLIDRATRAVRAVTGNFLQMRFDGDTLVGVGDPANRDPLAPPPLPAGVDAEGAMMFAVSHDGRYVAGWTPELIVEEGSGGGATTSPSPTPPSFLAVWDRVAGKRLWRDTTRCCGSWRFSPDDRFLERSDNNEFHASRELLRAASGEVLSFPGGLFPVSSDGQHVLVLRDRGPELWSIEPRQLIVQVPRPRTIVAQSRDGLSTAALDDYQLVLESRGRCSALGVTVRIFDAIEFSPDSRELHAGLEQSLHRRGDPSKPADGDWITRRTLAVWRTDTGYVARSLTVLGDDTGHPPMSLTVYPMPAGDQVAFALGNQLAVFDVRTGEVAKAVSSPWVSVPPSFAHHLILGPRSEIEQYAEEVAETFYGPVTAFASTRHPRGHFPVALAPDERHLAATAREGAIALWDRDRKRIPVAAHHDGALELLAFSPDGRLLATGGADGRVILTRAASGATVGTIALAGDRPRFLWWSPDSARLVIDTARRFRITVAPHGEKSP